jgi:hypothetical protein
MIDSDRFDSADFELYYELDSSHEKELHLTVKD